MEPTLRLSVELCLRHAWDIEVPGREAMMEALRIWASYMAPPEPTDGRLDYRPDFERYVNRIEEVLPASPDLRQLPEWLRLVGSLGNAAQVVTANTSRIIDWENRVLIIEGHYRLEFTMRHHYNGYLTIVKWEPTRWDGADRRADPLKAFYGKYKNFS